MEHSGISDTIEHRRTWYCQVFFRAPNLVSKRRKKTLRNVLGQLYPSPSPGATWWRCPACPGPSSPPFVSLTPAVVAAVGQLKSAGCLRHCSTPPPLSFTLGHPTLVHPMASHPGSCHRPLEGLRQLPQEAAAAEISSRQPR